jgi:DoxX
MSQAQYTRGGAASPGSGGTFDSDLNFFPAGLACLGSSRAMLVYIFIVEGFGKIAGYAGVADYMRAHGVDGRLLPLVILTELGGGLLVLGGDRAFWLLPADRAVLPLRRRSGDPTSENVAMAGAFSLWSWLVLASGRWTPGALAPSSGRASPSDDGSFARRSD